MRGPQTPSTDESASTTNRTLESEVSSLTQVEVSGHAELRWLQRTRDFDRTPESAWRKGNVCDLGRPCGFSEIRYDPPSETLLCARDGEVVTVLDANHEPVQDTETTETQRCAGCSRFRKDHTDPCQNCGTRAIIEQQHSTRFFERGNQ
jgi:hypothetical protein